jgi:hypothetical protein
MKTAFHKKHIPQEFKHLNIIGRGCTSIILECPENPDSVLMLTMDPIKKDWLADDQYGPGLVEDWKYHDEVDSMFLVYSSTLPRLRHLGKENKKLFKTNAKMIYDLLYSQGGNFNTDTDDSNKVDILYESLTGIDFFRSLIEFLFNYRDYLIDLGPKNAMETADGKIILTDPIISSEIYRFCKFS